MPKPQQTTVTKQDSRDGGMIDEPSSFATLATWEKFLADMLKVPDGDPAKAPLLKLAREMVPEKRSG